MAIFACGVASAQSGQTVYIGGAKYTVYTVAKGDTLYSLSKRYGVTTEELMQANPTLAQGLKAGENIKIPQKGVANAKSEKKKAKAAKKLFRNHYVRKGDTLYSIARIYGISMATLTADNPDVDPAHLAIGQMLYIRRSEIGTVSEEPEITPTTPEQTPEQSTPTTPTQPEEPSVVTPQLTTPPEREQGSVTTPEAEDIVADFQFRTLLPGERAEVALMLPLTAGERRQTNFVDFYQGFLLAADHLRQQGYQSHIHLYNTAHSDEKVAQIIDSGELERCNIIVGPVYEDTLIPVVRYAERHSIPVVSPLANLTQATGGNLFQMSPRPESKYDKIKSLFDGNKRVVVISGENNDADFEDEVKQMLGDMPYTTHQYIYEHPSIIEKREKARAEGANVPPSPSDLSPLMESSDDTLFIILAGTEVETDRILAALASAKISLTARSIKVPPYVVFGNNKWGRYRNIDRALFFSNNVIMLSTYHTDRTQRATRDFEAEYVKAFGAMPSLYTYRGYDAAMVFIRSLYGGMDSTLTGQRFVPLQTPYSFTQDENSKVRINGEWVRINYNSNFTITTE